MAWALGVAVFQLPAEFVDAVLWLGLILPFITGLFGVSSLYSGFAALAHALPSQCRGQRACLLRRLVVSWSVCYTAVTPVMIYTLWEYFARGP
jgi:TctA family transporter